MTDNNEKPLDNYDDKIKELLKLTESLLPLSMNNADVTNKDILLNTNWAGNSRYMRPWYDPDADYNTNAKSYYDYLARDVPLMNAIIRAINELLRRDLDVIDTNSVDLTKINTWINNNSILNASDIVKLQADVKISEQVEIDEKYGVLKNSIKVKSDGLYTHDLLSVVKSIDARLQKIENLLPDTTNLKPDDRLAIGNINVYGLKEDGELRIYTDATKSPDGSITNGA